MPQSINIFSSNKWGEPQQAGVGLEFGLLLKPDAKPVYNRPLSFVGFEGNSHSVSYWRHQYAPTSLYTSKKEFSATQLNAWADAADVLLTCAENGFSELPGSLKSQLYAATLNFVSGRGPFEPYREAAAWFIAYAEHSCPLNPGADTAIALNLVKLINEADDLD